MPNLAYFKGLDFQVVLFIPWESNTFHMPHIAHTKNNLTKSWLLIKVEETEKYLLLVLSSSTKQALAI